MVLPTVYNVRNQLKMKKLKGDQFSRFTYLSHHAIDMTPNVFKATKLRVDSSEI